MLRDLRLRRLYWTLVNQGIVSAGSFVVQIVLARQLQAADYGIFALLFSVLLTLQLCNGTLLFHPMSVRVSASRRDKLPRLLGASIILICLLSVVLAAVLAIALAVIGRSDLIISALAFFLAWQIQEGLRRGLLCDFRHAAAIVGDVITYGGQALIIVGLSRYTSISISGALYMMALSATLGAIMNARRPQLALPSINLLRMVFDDYWSIGGIPSLRNGFLSQART